MLLEHPARRLDDAAFELIDHAVRIDDKPGVGRAPHVRQTDFLVDVELDDHGGVGGPVLIARKGDAAAMAGAARRSRFPAGHGGDLLDHRARAFIGGDRQSVSDRILAGALGQLIDAAFQREHVRHGAETAQRRGAHRCFRHQMVDDALGRDVVERLGIAGGAAAIGFWHVVRRRLRRRIGQRNSAQQNAAGAGALVVRAAPDFLRPVGRLAGVVEQSVDLDDHRRGFRLVDELFLAPPAHADRLARHLHGDDGGVGGGIVGAVVAVAARALHVVHDDG